MIDGRQASQNRLLESTPPYLEKIAPRHPPSADIKGTLERFGYSSWYMPKLRTAIGGTEGISLLNC